MQAFKVETAGSLDADVELKIYGGGLDIQIDFNKGKVDIFSIQTYLSQHVFGVSSVEEMLACQPPPGGVEGTSEGTGYLLLANDVYLDLGGPLDSGFQAQTISFSISLQMIWKTLISGKASKVLDYLGQDSIKLDPAQVQSDLASEGALVSNETVMLAYKCGRDMTILTSRRMLFVDTKGISGKRVSNVVLLA